MPTKTTKAKVRYSSVLNLPKLPYNQFMALRDNIAINGVLMPILTDGGSPVRKIIDGTYRKSIADELGYNCPEIVQGGLNEEEMRTLARALNLARRQLTSEQKRQLIADQLLETPNRSNRWISKQLGVSHPTVSSVRAEMEATGKVFQFDRTLGTDGKYRPKRLFQNPPELRRPLDFYPKKLISRVAMQELYREQQGDFPSCDPLGVQNEVQAVPVGWVGDDIRDRLCSAKEVLAIKEVGCLYGVTLLLSDSHNGTIPTRRFEDQSGEPLPVQQSMGGVGRS
jgi:hypothetical protein